MEGETREGVIRVDGVAPLTADVRCGADFGRDTAGGFEDEGT